MKLKKTKLFNKRSSVTYVVNLFGVISLVFAYSKLVGIRVPFNGELKSYFCKLDTRESKAMQSHLDAYSYTIVPEDDLHSMLIHTLRNIFGGMQ